MENTQPAVKTSFPCSKCGRFLKFLSNHQRKCKLINLEIKEAREDLEVAERVHLSSQPDPAPQQHHSNEPLFEEQKFYWGERKGSDFTHDLDLAYEQIVYWRQNLFLLPSGKSGKDFIREITRLINCWIDNTALKPIALKSIMVMPALLLQKPSRASKSKDHLTALSRRISLWMQGNIKDLLHECNTIQDQLKASKKTMSTREISKRFIEKMSKGNINGAIKLLSDNMQNGILPLDDKTLELLKQKHPVGVVPLNDVLLTDTPVQLHPVRFEEIDSEMIRQSALKTRGGAGPSGLDGDG